MTAARYSFQRFTILLVRLICYGPLDDPIAAPYNEDVFLKSTDQCHRQHPALPLSAMIYNYCTHMRPSRKWASLHRVIDSGYLFGPRFTYAYAYA